jgi:hypothetical protein
MQVANAWCVKLQDELFDCTDVYSWTFSFINFFKLLKTHDISEAGSASIIR